MKTSKYYYELVKRFRERTNVEVGFGDYEPIRTDIIGIYCSRFVAMNEKDSYLESHKEALEDGTLVGLTVRKMMDTIEEVELISDEEMRLLGEIYG